MARRTMQDPLFALTSDQLSNFAVTSPMRLLSVLPDIHPSVGFALWNALRCMCPADGLQIKAVRLGPDGRPPAGAEPDEGATEELNALWASLPQEVGGLQGLQTQLSIQAMFTGLICAEAVPGAEGGGVGRVWPVDSMTIGFSRPDRNADLTPRQRQAYPDLARAAAAAGQGAPSINLNWVPLNPETFFWAAVDAQVDDPHGRAPYAPVLSEALADLALMQDLRDAVHNAAWPRLKVGYNLLNLHKVAVEVYRITDPAEAAKWVQARIDEVVRYVEDLYSDDNIVHDSSGSSETLQPGSFQGLEGVLNFLRHRLVQALKTLPTLMGINDGATYNYTSVEWGIYASGLESLRSLVAWVIARIGTLHLRLLGIPAVAVAVYQPIKTNDELVEANTANVKLQNAANAEKLGYKTHDEACMMVYGHKARREAMPGALESVSGTGEQSGQPGPKNGGQGSPDGGTNKDDRQARKSLPK